MVAEGLDGDPTTEEQVGSAAVGLEVLRYHCLRRLTARANGRPAGPESSIDKLLMTQAEQHLVDCAGSLLGGRSLASNEDGWFDRYIFARAGSIYGGSSQIQKNIIARRLLELPR